MTLRLLPLSLRKSRQIWIIFWLGKLNGLKAKMILISRTARKEKNLLKIVFVLNVDSLLRPPNLFKSIESDGGINIQMDLMFCELFSMYLAQITRAQHRVQRTSAGRWPHFRDSGPNGGFGVWWFFALFYSTALL